MDDGWRVCIAFGVLPRSLHSLRQALISALSNRLGDQVAVSSSRWGTQIFVYAPSAGSADEAAQVAREVLARHDVSAPVRTEFWSPRARSGGMRRTSRPPIPLPSGRLCTKPVRSESGKRR
jgi:hypothetical protein